MSKTFSDIECTCGEIFDVAVSIYHDPGAHGNGNASDFDWQIVSVTHILSDGSEQSSPLTLCPSCGEDLYFNPELKARVNES